MKKKAFTLIELLVVISIIALLVAILMPALGKAREQAKFTVCKTNMKQYYLGMAMYLEDNNDDYPESWHALFNPRGDNSTHYCDWHNDSYRYESNTNIQGPLFKYFKTMEIHQCPTFEGFARRYGETHPNHVTTIPVVPQYSYSQNHYLGGKKTATTYLGVRKSAEVKHPTEVVIFVEETLWTIPGKASHVLNDTCFRPRHPRDPAGFLGDCIATYHNTPLTKKDDGSGDAVFGDGHVELSIPFQMVNVGWGEVTSNFRYAWPKGNIPANCPY